MVPKNMVAKEKSSICFLNIYFMGIFPKLPYVESHRIIQEEGLQSPIKLLSVIQGLLVSYTISFSCNAL